MKSFRWVLLFSLFVAITACGEGNSQVTVATESPAPDSPTPRSSPASTATPTSGAPADPGVIRGRLSYPGHSFPPGYEVCAELIADGTLTCTLDLTITDRVGVPPSYELTVPPGEYYVFARVNAAKGYYTEAVPCGLRVGCPSHKQIPVLVKPGEVVDGIDPQDWFTTVP